MLRQIIVSTLIILVFMPAVVSAQTSDSARVSVCAPPVPVVASASIAEGFINFCVSYPPVVQPGSTVLISSTLTAPASSVPVFATAANAFLAPVGCTEGTPAVVVPSANGVAGTMWTAISFLTMTSEQCDLAAAGTLTIAAVPINIYNVNLAVNIQTENIRVDSFSYLCDAPGIVPNVFGTTTTTCEDPTFNTIISGALAVTHIFTEAIEVAFVTPLEVIGDFSFTNTGNTTMSSDFGDTIQNWIPLILALVLFAIAVMRQKPNYWLSGLAGALMIVCAAFCPWPANFSGYGARLVLLGLGAWTVIAAGLDIKDWNEQRKNKGEDTMEE